MLAVDLMMWWYTKGWGELIKRLISFVRKVVTTFSVPILLRTLFSPWRRIISYGDESVVAGMRAALDNLISRFVGFGVRCVVLLTSIISVVIITITGTAVVILWPLTPVVAIYLIIKGILG
jgi:hypothetical protein